MRLQYLLLYTICFVTPAKAVVIVEKPLQSPLPKVLKKKGTAVKGKKKRKLPKQANSLSPTYVKYLFPASIIGLGVLCYLSGNNKGKNLDDELEELEDPYSNVPLLLDETIPDFHPTKKDQNTYQLNNTGIFYADATDKPETIMGVRRERLEKETENEYKTLYTLDTDYRKGGTAGDGHCFFHVYMLCIVHQINCWEDISDHKEAHDELISKIQSLCKKAIAYYKKLRLIQQERELRVKEAYERFLKAVPIVLALLGRLKNEKSFQKRVALLNRVPRWVIADFLRAGTIVSNVLKATSEKKSIQKWMVAYHSKHLLNATCYYSIAADLMDNFRNDIGIQAFPYYLHRCSLEEFKGLFEWKAGAHNSIGYSSKPQRTNEDILYRKKVVMLFTPSHYSFAYHPSLLE